MYSIVEEYVNGFNGLVSAAKKKSNAYKNDNWSSASVSTAVSSAHTLQQQANEGRATGAPAATTAAPATAQTAATSAIVGSRSFEYVGKTPATAQTSAPATAQTAATATAQTAATYAPTTEKKSVWPWIVGGIALLGVGYMILKK